MVNKEASPISRRWDPQSSPYSCLPPRTVLVQEKTATGLLHEPVQYLELLPTTPVSGTIHRPLSPGLGGSCVCSLGHPQAWKMTVRGSEAEPKLTAWNTGSGVEPPPRFLSEGEEFSSDSHSGSGSGSGNNPRSLTVPQQFPRLPGEDR